MSGPQLALIAVVYLIAFWTLAFLRPPLALIFIIALAPFQNDISGGGPLRFSIAEVNLFLALPVALIRARRLIFGPTVIPASIYLAVCVFSAIGQWRGSSLVALMQTALYTVILVMVVASLPRREEDYRPALIGLIIISLFLAVLLAASGTSYILGLHKNGVGGSLAIGFVVAFELWLGSRGRVKRFYLVASAVLAVACLLCLSRGAWMTAVAGMAVVLILRGRIVVMFKCVAVLVPLLAIGWRMIPDESRSYAFGFDKERTNIKSRYESFEYARTTFWDNPIQGAGVGFRKEYDATNILVMMLAETGVPGFLAFMGLHGVIVYFILRAYRRVPRTSFGASLLAIALALVVGKFMHGLVDHYWSRGSLTVVWASVGMAARVGYEEKRRRKRARRVALQPAKETAAVPPEPALLPRALQWQTS